MKAAILLAVVLTGCASTPQEPVSGPNGRPLFVTRCGVAETCYREAATRCPAGYTVVSQNNDRDRGGSFSVGGGFGRYGSGGGIGIGLPIGASTDTTVTIECK